MQQSFANVLHAEQATALTSNDSHQVKSSKKYSCPRTFVDHIFHRLKELSASHRRNTVKCEIYLGHVEYDYLARYAFENVVKDGFTAIDLDNKRVFGYRFHQVLESSHLHISALDG